MIYCLHLAPSNCEFPAHKQTKVYRLRIKSAGLVFLYLLLKPLDGAHVDLLTFVIKNRDIHVKIY